MLELAHRLLFRNVDHQELILSLNLNDLKIKFLFLIPIINEKIMTPHLFGYFF